MRSKWTLSPVACLLILLVLGCGGRDPALPDLVPVNGTITLDGKPLAAVLVNFLPQGKTRGNGATGYTDENGKYELTDAHGGAGAPVGEYRVVLSKLVMPDGSPYDASAGVAPMDSPAKEFLPGIYSDMEMSTLTFTVPEAGGPADFDLKSQR